MMRKLLIAILPLLFLGSACTPSKIATYDIGMEEVERPADVRERYGEAEIIERTEADTSKYIYEDNLLSIAWAPLPSKFYFDLENKTEHSMKIIWDEAAFVDENGQSMRVMHSGVKYSERDSPQPPSIVVRGGRITDIVYPTDYVTFAHNNWIERGIFEPYAAHSVTKLGSAKDNIGKSVQVLLPVEIQGNVNEYIFTFKVNDVELPSGTQTYGNYN